MEKMNVKLEVFEGPFDLLFHLIEKNKINLYDIPIFELTNQYLNYINSLDKKDMDNISEFLLMAATLIEIKSKMLLPKIVINSDESGDPREELVQKLIEYKLYKKIAKTFENTEIFLDKVLFKKPENNLIEVLIEEKLYKAEDFLNGLSLHILFDIYKDVLSRKELKIDKVRSSFNSIGKDVFTIENQAKYILNILTINQKILFKDIFINDYTKIEIVVSFLAVLEMIKLKVIKTEQEKNFGEIVITLI